MVKIDLILLFQKLIKEYEKVHGKTRFEAIKIKNNFIYTKIDQKMLEILKLEQMDVVGKECTEIPIKRDLAEKLPSIFERVWNGKEMLYFLFPSTNEEILFVVILKAVSKNGRTEKIEGYCAPINIKEFNGMDLSQCAL
jgi:hypothetical protein